ncbi:MAG: PaaI family thioesterase [Maricaulaceae bacterium]
MDEDRLSRLWNIAPVMTEATPHAREIGIKFVAVDIGRATLSLDYNKNLIGDPKTKVVHGGAVTTLLDQACGLAALAGFEAPTAAATLNLSIDYMRAAKPGEAIIAEAHCYKTTRHVAFVRAIAHDGDDENPVAMAQATFMATAFPGARKTKTKAAPPETKR